MSQAQYNAIAKARLIDLARIPSDLLTQLLQTKPEWLRLAVLQIANRGNS
ncbi:hypothetical protein [Vibrio mimicus]|nr:hypothetical protein [Vibrio mimicus]EEY36233.1 hypothetical protein VII_003776 [Vibrio mimicus MB451]